MKKIHYAWFIMIACCAIQTTGGIVGTASSNLYQAISAELNIGIGKLTIYLTIMSLTMALLFPVAGKLLGKNLKLVLLSGGLCQYAALASMSTFSNVYQFYAAGLFLGIGMSITLYMAVPILINMWFHKKAGIAIGIALSCNGLAAALFSQVSAFVLSITNWRTAFLVLAVCGLLIYIPAILFIVKTPEQKGLKPYGYDEGNSLKAVTQETTSQTTLEGISFHKAIKQPQFYCILTLCIALCAVQAETPYIASFSTVQFNFTTNTAATMLSLFSLGIVLGNVSFGAIDDTLGHLKAYILGTSIIIASTLLLIFGKTFLPFVVIGIFFSGFALATFTVIPPLITNAVFGPKDYNRIWACFMSAGSIAGAVAPPLYGTIYDITGSFTMMFVLLIILAGVSMLSGIIALKKS